MLYLKSTPSLYLRNLQQHRRDAIDSSTVHIMLILTTNGFRIDVHQFGQVDLQSSCNDNPSLATSEIKILL